MRRPSWEAPVAALFLIVLIPQLIRLYRNRADTPRIGLTAGGVVVRGYGRVRYAPWESIEGVDLTSGNFGMPVLWMALSRGPGRGWSGDLKVPLGALAIEPERMQELVRHYWTHPEARLGLGTTEDAFFKRWQLVTD